MGVSLRVATYGYVAVCAVYVCMCVCVRVCMRVYVCAYVCVLVWVVEVEARGARQRRLSDPVANEDATARASQVRSA